MKLPRREPIFIPPISRYEHKDEFNHDFFQEKGEWHFDRTEEPKRKISLDNLFTNQELKKLRK